MSDEPATNGEQVCSFCQKIDRQVQKIILGPDVAICDECVALCIEILESELGRDWQSSHASKRL